jgi:formiminotetrahydrofolate cyclodeaminase
VAATEAPFKTVQACAEMARWAEALAGRSNKNASSDLEVASLMALAGAEAAAANVYVNLPAIADQDLAADLLERTKHLVDEISRTAATTREQVRSGSAREPLPEAGE